MRQAALRARVWRFKRTVDIVLSLILLVVTAPVMAIAALAVKLGSKGPVLFRQRRIGQYGEEIVVLKFRTLPADHVDDTLERRRTTSTTRSDACCAALSIDELPQLWNVLRGDMSLVGPRPERGYLVEQFNTSVSGYRDRHRLPGRPHRLGAGARSARRHVAARACALRQPVHRALVAVARRRHPRPHLERELPRADDDVGSRRPHRDRRRRRATRTTRRRRRPPRAAAN